MPLIFCSSCNRKSILFDKGLMWKELINKVYAENWRRLKVSRLTLKQSSGSWACPYCVSLKTSYLEEVPLEWLLENELSF